MEKEKEAEVEKEKEAEKEAEAGKETEAEAEAEKEKDKVKEKVSPRQKIFLVDDTEFSLTKTKQILKDYYTVYTLDSAPKMFELLEKVKPDLILLDINMPGVDGFETIKNLKAEENYTEIPVIFLSGVYDEESIVKGLALGAVDHIIKPYTPEALHASISKHLNPVTYHDDLIIDNDTSTRRLSILAVDDSPSMLRSIHFALHSRYKVHTLQKPENLKKIIEGLKPDLFLLDYNMPEINGFELVKVIREFKEFKNTPIVFLTSESSPEHLKEAINLGVNDYVVKPFNPKKLRDKITHCLEKK